ncbi:unnamed protein product [Paramecium primaurelia]|uniref:Uncharacterized protein n=1 Tax=Paramecium primaurelia TaxID=5886 RepID=A0A8S1JU82_PARPR|nr:unnamed protein product [Paramecium primaurelia]
MKCPLNYYRIIQELKFKVNVQPALIYANIVNRNENNISVWKPKLYMQKSNAQLNMIYLEQIDDPNVIIDPYLQIAKYCFNKICQNNFSLSYYFTSYMFDRYWPNIYDDLINFQYCNLVGVDQMRINYIFQIEEDQKHSHIYVYRELELWNAFKKQIFLLKKANMILSLAHDNILTSSKKIVITNFDSVEVKNFKLSLFNGLTWRILQLFEGFWRPNYQSEQIEECFKNFNFGKVGWGQGNSICKLGHIGAFCEECDIYNIRGDGNYLKKQQDSYCRTCFGVEDSIIPFIATLIWSFISIIITLKSIEQSNQLFKSLKQKQKFSKIIFNLEQGHQSFLIKMFLNYLQIFSVIFTFNIQFSFSFTLLIQPKQIGLLFIRKSINKFDLLQNNFNACTHDILIYTCNFGISNFQLVQKNRNESFQLGNHFQQSTQPFVSNYGGLVKMYFSIVSKRDVSSQSYIQGDVSLLFGSKEHLIWIFSFVLPGIGVLSLIITLSLFIVMYFKKDQHDNY